MSKAKYRIAAGYIGGPQVGDMLPENRSDLGWSHDLARAMERASRISRHIRTDVPVFIHDGVVVLASTGTNNGPGGVFERELRWGRS
jgi:hypothetical protein